MSSFRRLLSKLHVLDSPLYSNSWFSADFALLLAPLAIEEDCLAEAISPNSQIAASNRIQGTSHKNLDRNTAQIPCLDWNNCKMRQMDWVKSDVWPAIARA